ncbi:hypothetical protein [Treponema endosymbiont of Eucomonympha sp.]|uniref:hypothetical protein n=1 Tax=Treponema endosymbiont of Eucomonympha sp. TaxID=1580831 RepID=UPI0007804603|nr:hypothetical protein [Treponema endosymbiont of Eucomonympha sp.]
MKKTLCPLPQFGADEAPARFRQTTPAFGEATARVEQVYSKVVRASGVRQFFQGTRSLPVLCTGNAVDPAPTCRYNDARGGFIWQQNRRQRRKR